MTDIQSLLDQAINETVHILRGEEFLLKDLFKGYEWNRIPHKYRLLLGNLFLDYVRENKTNVTAVRKTSSNQQKYRKVHLVEAPFGMNNDIKKF